MVITNRDLPAGTRLVGKYKKQTFVCTVGVGEHGEGIAFVLEDGQRFKSPSSAASHVMGGGAVNGWRFWSVEGAEPESAPTEAATANIDALLAGASKAKAERKPRSRPKFKLFEKMPDGRFWCQACQKPFDSADEKPEACAEGHRADDPELTSAPAPEAVAAEREPTAVEA